MHVVWAYNPGNETNKKKVPKYPKCVACVPGKAKKKNSLKKIKRTY